MFTTVQCGYKQKCSYAGTYLGISFGQFQFLLRKADNMLTDSTRDDQQAQSTGVLKSPSHFKEDAK